MATVIVSPAMQAKAERLAEMVPTLSRGRSKVNGVTFYIFPASTPGVAHWSNGLGCTCEGHRRRGTCTHALSSGRMALNSGGTSRSVWINRGIGSSVSSCDSDSDPRQPLIATAAVMIVRRTRAG